MQTVTVRVHMTLLCVYVYRWYHPGITRHISECLLLSREIQDGTYLLRQSGSTLALSVRYTCIIIRYIILESLYNDAPIMTITS